VKLIDLTPKSDVPRQRINLKDIGVSLAVSQETLNKIEEMRRDNVRRMTTTAHVIFD